MNSAVKANITGMGGHRRRWAGLAVGGLLAVVVAHGATWFYVTGRILDGIPMFTAQAAREGWVLTAGPPRRAGWPWVARVRVPDLVATRPLGDGNLVWTAEHVDLDIEPDDPGRLRIAPGGANAVRLGQGAPTPMRAGTAFLLVQLDGVGANVLAVRDLVVGTPDAGLRAASVEARFEAAVAAGTAEGVTTLPPLSTPFDGGARFSARVQMLPPVTPGASPRAAAAAWQAAGGRATVPELLLDWGPLRVEGTVSGGLDPALQPFGEARLRVTGGLAVLEAASRAGLIQPGPASAARAVLTLLTMAAQGGPIGLPVLLRDRTLTAAQFALLRVPVLSWGGD